MNDCKCCFRESVEKIKKINENPKRICTNCDIIKDYNILINSGKIDPIRMMQALAERKD